MNEAYISMGGDSRKTITLDGVTFFHAAWMNTAYGQVMLFHPVDPSRNKQLLASIKLRDGNIELLRVKPRDAVRKVEYRMEVLREQGKV